MENLDTDLPLPPEAIPETVRGLELPAANSWLPFTGDMDLRAAVSEFLVDRTGHRYDPEREILITSGGTEAILDVMLATVDPGDPVLLTDPTYAGIVNRVRLAGGVPRFAPYRVRGGRVAARRRRVRRRGARRGDGRADEPVDAVGRRADGGGVGRRLRDLRRARPPAALRLCDGAAAVRSPRARASAALRRDGRPHRDRRVALEGAPDDRLARRLGRRACRAGRVGRLGARLQHDDADRHRALRRHGGVARRSGPRRGRGCRARAPPRHDPRCARGLAGRPPGRRLVDADRRDRARHDAGRAVSARCSSMPRSPRRR